MDRAALITGGSSGIGYAIAKALHEDGYGVTLSARRPEKLEAAARTLGNGADVLAIAADMGDEAEIERVVAAHADRFGRLDVLVNNAGIGIGGGMLDTETKHLDLMLNVNLRAVFLLARGCMPMLAEAATGDGKAVVVNTASLAGKRGHRTLSAYSATKFGVVGLTQAMHDEFSERGIHVTALCPGFVATPMTEDVEDEVPKEQMIKPEDLAEAVRFVLRTSRNCVIPEIAFIRPGESVF